MTEIVEYDRLVSFLKTASAYEIYRLSVAIQNELANPARLSDLSRKIKVGDVVEYFDARTNTAVQAVILKKSSKNVVVQQVADGRQCQLPLYMLKIDSREFVFDKKEGGLNKNSVKVGELVGFHNKHGENVIGTITRLNQKSVSLVTANKQQWRVSYRLLYPIIDGERGNYHLPKD